MTQRVCSIEDCPRPSKARGWCAAHYKSWRVHGDPMAGRKLTPKPWGACAFEGCPEPHLSRGWCGAHYQRWRTHGDPAVGGRPVVSVVDRFNSNWTLGDLPALAGPDGPCWIWTGCVSPTGYGTMQVPGRKGPKGAHRVSYELHKGPIPEGLHVHHICFRRNCVNPDHLEALTLGDNTRQVWERWRKVVYG
jgi:hypothetical protein